VNGYVGMVLKPTEKKPAFQINMKPLTKNIPETLKPEVSHTVNDLYEWNLLHLLENMFDRKRISASPSSNPKAQ